MTITLADRREAVTARLATLEREQGAALLDDKPFDASALIHARAELAAIEAAEDETMRRVRSAADAALAGSRAEARKALKGALDDYLAAVGRVEKSARSLVADLKLMEGLSETLRKKVLAAGSRPPVALDAGHMQHCHSAFLISLLSGVAGRNYYGAIKWSSVHLIPDLTAHARKAIGDALHPIIEGE